VQAWKGLSLSRGRGQDGHFRVVLQGIAAQYVLKYRENYDVRDALEKKKEGYSMLSV
jgi:hypothetical protein